MNRFGGVMLSSTDPARLHEWYLRMLPPDSDTREHGYRILGYEGTYLFLDARADVGVRNPEPGRVILNFEVADARSVVARMRAAATPWLAPLEDRDGTLFATAIDPDGNYVQLVQLAPTHAGSG